MPSKKATEQCMTWLRSMAADRDSLNGINAELVLNVIAEQKNRLDRLGAQFQHMKNDRDALAMKIEEYTDSSIGLNDF